MTEPSRPRTDLEQRRPHRRAITVVYLGVFSPILLPVGVGAILAAITLWQARIADREIAERPRELTGKALVSVGRSLAYVTLVIAGIVLLLFVVELLLHLGGS